MKHTFLKSPSGKNLMQEDKDDEALIERIILCIDLLP